MCQNDNFQNKIKLTIVSTWYHQDCSDYSCTAFHDYVIWHHSYQYHEQIVSQFLCISRIVCCRALSWYNTIISENYARSITNAHHWLCRTHRAQIAWQIVPLISQSLLKERHWNSLDQLLLCLHISQRALLPAAHRPHPALPSYFL